MRITVKQLRNLIRETIRESYYGDNEPPSRRDLELMKMDDARAEYLLGEEGWEAHRELMDALRQLKSVGGNNEEAKEILTNMCDALVSLGDEILEGPFIENGEVTYGSAGWVPDAINDFLNGLKPLDGAIKEIEEYAKWLERNSFSEDDYNYERDQEELYASLRREL
jgi:hypothetical protein